MRAQDLALGGEVEALHWGDLALERLDHLIHGDICGRAREAVPPWHRGSG